MEVRKLEEKDLFEEVESEKQGQFYVVDLIAKSCTCRHFKFRGVQCKHIKAVTPVESLTVETIPTILGEISRRIRELALSDKKHETLIYTDDPPEKDFHYELIY